MKNYTAYKYGDITRQLPFLVTFETLLVMVSVLIIISSSLVIKHIQNKAKKTRADEMFVVLMVSDIAVALISMPALGVLSPFWEKLINDSKKGSKLPFVITAFCYEFPYTFSYIVTTIIAVDRLLIITQHKRYQKLITKKRLKYIMLCIFVLVLIYGIISCYVLPETSSYEVTGQMRKSYLIFNTIAIFIIFVAYIYILFFVNRRSKAMIQCKHGKIDYCKKLSKAIFYIFTFQIICILPYLLMHMMIEFHIEFPLLLVAPWLGLLRNTQGLFDGVILLHNQR